MGYVPEEPIGNTAKLQILTGKPRPSVLAGLLNLPTKTTRPTATAVPPASPGHSEGRNSRNEDTTTLQAREALELVQALSNHIDEEDILKLEEVDWDTVAESVNQLPKRSPALPRIDASHAQSAWESQRKGTTDADTGLLLEKQVQMVLSRLQTKAAQRDNRHDHMTQEDTATSTGPTATTAGNGRQAIEPTAIQTAHGTHLLFEDDT